MDGACYCGSCVCFSCCGSENSTSDLWGYFGHYYNHHHYSKPPVPPLITVLWRTFSWVAYRALEEWCGGNFRISHTWIRPKWVQLPISPAHQRHNLRHPQLPAQYFPRHMGGDGD